MAVQCVICLESCAASGTDHAPYSTPCGHVMGKECLEKFKKHLNNNNFNCPSCHKDTIFNNCHAIYGIAPEVKDSVTKPRNACKKLKENFFFSEDFKKNIDGTIKFFDEHNGNILIAGIAGETPSLFSNKHFIKLIVTKGRKTYNLSKSKLNIECSCLCFNKHENGVIEFCVGYINGTMKLHRYKFDGDNLKRISKNKLFCLSLLSSINRSKAIINSICFLNCNTVVFSIGKGKLRVWNKKEEWLSKTEIINECIDNESNYITQLKKTNHDDCLGIMNNRIYVFEKNGTSYELASQVDKTIISYSIDPKFYILIVLYSNESNLTQEHSTSQLFVKYKIIYDKEPQKYYTKKMRIIQNIGDEIPKSIMPSFFAIKNSKRPLVYHGIFTNIENNKLEIISLNNSRKCEGFKCVGDENLEDTPNCLGVTFVDRKKFFFKSNSIRTIAVIFKNKVVVMDISYTATY
uniref:RING-type domain-containing protein n=1 Tax=Strongyloides papillosus TaxID=174720 RepID=A0A0N5B1S1_STREA